MDVLVNASNLTKGGGIQVAASFVVESRSNPKGINWHYALSRAVADEVSGLGLSLEGVEVFEVSPSRNRKQRLRLRKLEQSINPDAVFTVFGPAYVRFRASHLLGVAACWVTHSTWLAYSTLPGWFDKLTALLSSVYRGWWFRSADRWVVEAENARSGMAKRLGIPSGKVDVVPNTCATMFAQANVTPASRPTDNDPVRLIYVSAYYPHKNLDLIPRVAAALKAEHPARNFSFILTLPPADAEKVLEAAEELEVSSYIDNVGRVPLNQLVELYQRSDICFMPSVLETFSATYVEAMATGRPIVASDLDFAHAVCRDSAIYFDPRDPAVAARRIVELLDDESMWQQCISRGKARLDTLPTARQRYEQYVESIYATLDSRSPIAAEAKKEL